MISIQVGIYTCSLKSIPSLPPQASDELEIVHPRTEIRGQLGGLWPADKPTSWPRGLCPMRSEMPLWNGSIFDSFKWIPVPQDWLVIHWNIAQWQVGGWVITQVARDCQLTSPHKPKEGESTSCPQHGLVWVITLLVPQHGLVWVVAVLIPQHGLVWVIAILTLSNGGVIGRRCRRPPPSADWVRFTPRST